MKNIYCSLLVLATFTVFAQDASMVRKKNFNIKDGVALQGWDPVSYFKGNKPVKGSSSIALFYAGVTYYFSSEANKAAFKSNPSQYEPQYGGWCAYAMGHDGSKVEVDPETYKIINGKLFLFYNQFFNNTLKSWNKDEANLHLHADANWQKIFHQ